LEIFCAADCAVDPQRLLLPGVDAADPRRDHAGEPRESGGPARGEDSRRSLTPAPGDNIGILSEGIWKPRSPLWNSRAAPAGCTRIGRPSSTALVASPIANSWSAATGGPRRCSGWVAGPAIPGGPARHKTP